MVSNGDLSKDQDVIGVLSAEHRLYLLALWIMTNDLWKSNQVRGGFTANRIGSMVFESDNIKYHTILEELVKLGYIKKIVRVNGDIYYLGLDMFELLTDNAKNSQRYLPIEGYTNTKKTPILRYRFPSETESEDD